MWEYSLSILQNCTLFILGFLSSNKLGIEEIQFMTLMVSGVLCFFLGFFLIYNKMTMVANSLSHTTLLGVVCSFFVFKLFTASLQVDQMPLKVLLSAGFISCALTVFVMGFLNKRINQEASNAFSFTALFALGIFASSVFLKNAHLGIESVIGDLEAVSLLDLKALLYALIAVLAIGLLFYQRLVLISFDQIFSKSIQINSDRYRFCILFMASFILILCFRSLGVILVLNALVTPVLIARLFFNSKKRIFSFGLGIIFIQSITSIAFVQEIYQRFSLPLSTTGVFGTLGLIFWLCAFLIKKFQLSIKKSLNFRA